jgi:hypothetical protein
MKRASNRWVWRGKHRSGDSQGPAFSRSCEECRVPERHWKRLSQHEARLYPSRTLQDTVKGRWARKADCAEEVHHEFTEARGKVRQVAEPAYLHWIMFFKMPGCNQKVPGSQCILTPGAWASKCLWKAHRRYDPCCKERTLLLERLGAHTGRESD